MSEPLPTHDDLDELVDVDPIRLRDASFCLLAEVDRLRRHASEQATAMGDLLDENDALQKKANSLSERLHAVTVLMYRALEADPAEARSILERCLKAVES